MLFLTSTGNSSRPRGIKTCGLPNDHAPRRNFTDAFETADSKQERGRFKPCEWSGAQAQDGRTVLAEIAGDLGLDVIEADDFVGKLSRSIRNLCGIIGILQRPKGSAALALSLSEVGNPSVSAPWA